MTGASWDTFSGSNETIDDLVDGGIPRLSARDICRVMNEVVQRRSRPLIISGISRMYRFQMKKVLHM